MSDEDEVEPEVIAPIVPGVARALSPLLRRIALDVDGIAGPNTYLIGIDEIVVVAPGPHDAGHRDAVAGCCGDRQRWIVCTGAADASGVNITFAVSIELFIDLIVDWIGKVGLEFPFFFTSFIGIMPLTVIVHASAGNANATNDSFGIF
jgi:hypothetical protein